MYCGSRNPRNILLEHDSCLHDGSENIPHNNKLSVPSHSRPCGQEMYITHTPSQSGSYSSRGYTTPADMHNRANEPHFQDMQDRRMTKMFHQSPTDNFRHKQYCHNNSSNFGCREKQGAECIGDSYSTPNGMMSKKNYSQNSNTVRPTEYGEQFLQPHLKESPEARNCIQQFRSGMVNSNGQQVEHRKTGPAAVSDCSSKDTTATAAASFQAMAGGKGSDGVNRCSREKPRGTPFSCNDCKEPQCLYCWRKLQDARGADFSFLDGFETHEPVWKPSRKNVDLFNGHYLKPNHGGLKTKKLDDNLQSCNQIRKEEHGACQSSYPQQEEPKWKPANRIHDNHDHQNGGIYGTEECNNGSRKAPASQFKENEWQWPLGKGRGMGAVPGEWLPPFRNTSDDHRDHQLHRGKGLGAMPNLEDWVPPFREEQQQPFYWHRRKGTGDCPPRDQWLAPWRDPRDNVRQTEICSGR